MKLHRFYIRDIVDGKSQIDITSEDLVNQLRNVFRFGQGDKIIIFNGSGFDFLVSIQGYTDDTVSLMVDEKCENRVRPQRETYLFASLIKKDNFEWVVQKATELGVSHIIPIFSARCEKKNLNSERLQKIIIEAAEQSGRGTIPTLYEIADLQTVLTNYGHIKSIVWDPYAEKFSSQEVEESIGAYIGPEGGWTAEELDLFRQRNIPVRSLGPQVLRSETAVIAVISRLVF